MHTEHLNNVRPGLVAFGWFLSAALTSLVVFALIALGILPRDGIGGTGSGLLALGLGFFAGGWYVGMRAGAAPILYAVAMGLFSLVLWLVANLLLGGWLDAESWNVGSAYGSGLLLLQIVAAALGGRLASRDARRGSAAAS